jgi:hypothetical protein
MRVHASILIQRRITVVFTYLSTPNCLPSWVTGVAMATGPPPEQNGVGATLALERTAPTSRGRSTWEVTAYETPRCLALRRLDDDGTAGAEVRWTLEGLASGATRIRVEADLDAVSFFQPASADLAELGTRQVQRDLKDLKRQLEAGGEDLLMRPSLWPVTVVTRGLPATSCRDPRSGNLPR